MFLAKRRVELLQSTCTPKPSELLEFFEQFRDWVKLPGNDPNEDLSCITSFAQYILDEAKRVEDE